MFYQACDRELPVSTAFFLFPRNGYANLHTLYRGGRVRQPNVHAPSKTKLSLESTYSGPTPWKRNEFHECPIPRATQVTITHISRTHYGVRYISVDPYSQFGKGNRGRRLDLADHVYCKKVCHYRISLESDRDPPPSDPVPSKTIQLL